jgi:hypothetical protein
MKRFILARFARAVVWSAAVAAAVVLGTAGRALAADHGDAPSVAHDQGTDIADVFTFLDPNDNSRLIIITTFRGFIASGEIVNFGIFDPAARFRIEIENTDDPKPDLFIDVRFSQRTTTAEAQTATVTLSKKFGGNRRARSFDAPATNPTLDTAPNEPVITTDSESGIRFFAGCVDDPFFFDIPGFSRFAASARAGAPDPTVLQRGRDSFAGYNCMCIALDIPVASVKGEGNVIGVDLRAQRRTESQTKTGEIKSKGTWRNADRMGNPAVNVTLIPFARKNAHNAADTRDDADGEFAQDILSTLDVFGTDAESRNILASVAITNGDFVRVNTTIANTGPGGGNNPEAAFPNGRRLGDDTVDILLTVIANRMDLGDSVDDNDVPRRDTFPFVAPPQQPRVPGVIDDNTRN